MEEKLPTKFYPFGSSTRFCPDVCCAAYWWHICTISYLEVQSSPLPNAVAKNVANLISLLCHFNWNISHVLFACLKVQNLHISCHCRSKISLFDCSAQEGSVPFASTISIIIQTPNIMWKITIEQESNLQKLKYAVLVSKKEAVRFLLPTCTSRLVMASPIGSWNSTHQDTPKDCCKELVQKVAQVLIELHFLGFSHLDVRLEKHWLWWSVSTQAYWLRSGERTQVY